jgi:hypothetical protein
MRPPRSDLSDATEGHGEWNRHLSHLELHCGFTRCLAEVALLRHRGLTEKAVAARLDIPYETAHARFRRLYREHQLDGVVALVLLVERALLSAERDGREVSPETAIDPFRSNQDGDAPEVASTPVRPFRDLVSSKGMQAAIGR